VAGLRFDAINIVIADVGATTEFLQALGLALEDVPPEWAPHHRGLPADRTDFDAELDSSVFAEHWGGLPDGFAGVVVNLRTDERDGVDGAYDEALRLGASGLRAPYDAFWGSRYAVVEAPGPVAVGFMSPPDPARLEPPPEVSEFS